MATRLPEVLTKDEVWRVLSQADKRYALPLRMLYSMGMRLIELVPAGGGYGLARGQIIVRAGKGNSIG